jgi:hypothetical protein
MNIRSKSQRFLNLASSQDVTTLLDNEQQREQSAFPQLTSRVDVKGEKLLDEINERRNLMSKTLYKVGLTA